MASRPKITGRLTSLAAAFVHAIIPRHSDAEEQRRLYERFGIDPTKCVYCGRDKTDSDHFRAIVRNGRPSGFFHSPDNVVPACGPCNQSKGGLDWRSWINGPAKGAPGKRISDLTERIERLSAFELNAGAVRFSPDELRGIVGAELWDRYWKRLEALRESMKVAQAESEQIRDKLQESYNARARAIPKIEE